MGVYNMGVGKHTHMLPLQHHQAGMLSGCVCRLLGLCLRTAFVCVCVCVACCVFELLPAA